MPPRRIDGCAEELRARYPGPSTTITCRPGSPPVTHGEACMKLHARRERPSCPTLSTPSSSISSNGSVRAPAPTPKSSRLGGRLAHACRFGRPLRSVASSTVNLHRKAVPALLFRPPGQSTCASIAVLAIVLTWLRNETPPVKTGGVSCRALLVSVAVVVTGVLVLVGGLVYHRRHGCIGLQPFVP
jgi:hypothetical protein